uniref:Solute carrier family 28 member 3-like n=1 Tax=Saccoglossus kowalevskii TaxID=10224 RepID=A0ABM0MHE8_SACKO|nr:PREDICTED: solute carrier family 28 member 3-like [Saccoglossus kowalevskii]
MQYTMGISGVEAISAAANVFLGMTTVPIMVKPYLKDMTSSELHCLITGGFATIAGSVLGAYISFGISAAHLLSASVISAPAAIAVSKIFYPETKRPKTLKSDFEFQMPQEKNIMEAMANAVQDGLKICAAVAAQLIAIIAELAFLDAVLAWLGALVNYPELTFSLICRYLLYPTSWLMGVDTHADCHTVAELVGTKTFANEFVAYGDLSVLIKNRETGLGPTLTVRSEVIATYALCGFSNLGSIGVMIGSFGPIASDRKAEVAILCLRAIVAATVACLLTGCIAGLLYDEGPRLYVPDSLVGNMTTAVY